MSNIFKVGDKVRFSWDSLIGEVLEVRDDNVSTGTKYLIKWEERLYAPDWEISDELVLIDEQADKQAAVRVQTKLDEAASLLERAWEAWNAARQDKSFFYLEDTGMVDVDKFAQFAESFGWSASSMRC